MLSVPPAVTAWPLPGPKFWLAVTSGMVKSAEVQVEWPASAATSEVDGAHALTAVAGLSP